MEVKDKLLQVISSKFGMDQIKEDEINKELAAFDSLDHIDLLYAIEDAFKIKIPIDRSFKNCDDIVTIINHVKRSIIDE